MSKSAYEHTKEWRAKQDPEVLREKRREEGRKYRAKYPERVRAYTDSWREKNIELHRAQDAANRRRKRRVDPEGERRRMRKFKAKQEQLLIDLAGRERSATCELCGEKAKTVFDHCHASGKFRGWLCQRCNRTLGQVKDNTRLLRKMVDYLNRGGFGYGPFIILDAETNEEVGICNPLESAGLGELPN